MNHTQGFTLVELLIVISILAILLVIILPNLLTSRQAANDTATKAYLRHCITAAEMTRDAQGIIPSAIHGKTCADNALGTAAQPEPSAVQAGSSKLILLSGGSVAAEATSSTGKRFRFDGGQFTTVP